MGRRYSSKDVETVTMMRNKGLKFAEIASITGFPPGSIHGILNAERPPKTERSPLPMPTVMTGSTEEIKKNIKYMYGKGKTLQSVVSASGLTEIDVVSILREEENLRLILEGEMVKTQKIKKFLSRVKSAGIDYNNPVEREKIVEHVRSRCLHRDGKMRNSGAILDVLFGLNRGGDLLVNQIHSMSLHDISTETVAPLVGEHRQDIDDFLSKDLPPLETREDEGTLSLSPVSHEAITDPVMVAINRIENLKKRENQIVRKYGKTAYEGLISEQKKLYEETLNAPA